MHASPNAVESPEGDHGDQGDTVEGLEERREAAAAIALSAGEGTEGWRCRGYPGSVEVPDFTPMAISFSFFILTSFGAIPTR